MAKTHLKLVKPAIQKRAVGPLRRPNSEFRSREHLTETEVEKLIEAAKSNRRGHRDATMLLVAYRHGLRASEVTDMRWEQIDWNSATLHVRRVKNGKPSTHPIRGDEMRALRKLKREAPKSPFVFVSERGGPPETPASVGTGVGKLNGVGVIASGAPDTGTMVGTMVGLGIAVGWAFVRGAAPRLFLQASSSPSTLNP